MSYTPGRTDKMEIVFKVCNLCLAFTLPYRNMKISCKTIQSTTLAPHVIIGKIVSALDHRDYRVTNLTSSIVEFDDSPWKLMWRHEAVRRLSGGKFEIAISGNDTLITFSWYRSLWAQVLILAALSIAMISNGEYYAPLFFLTFYVIAITINIVTLRSIARDLLQAIAE
jgi:hypothetical protein